MIEMDFAKALNAVVKDWIISTAPEQQTAELLNSANLSIELSVTLKHSLIKTGISPNDVCNYILNSPFCHFKEVFDPGDLGETPQSFTPVPDVTGTIAGRAAALALHGLLQLETVSYGSENEGNLFVNIVKINGDGRFSEKSKKDLRGHTDGVSFPFINEDDPENSRIAPSPDFVTLIGLRNPEEVPTRVIPLEIILKKLSSSEIEELKKAQYSIRSQETFVQGMKRILGKEHVLFDVPVLKDIENKTHIRYSHTKVVPPELNEIAKAASDKLEKECESIAIPVVINPGDICIVSNRISLHGRALPGSDIGGESRWLLRTYALDTRKLDNQKRHSGHVLFP